MSDSDSISLSISLAPGTLRIGHTDDRGNYHITHDDQIGYGGKVAKFEANLAVIKLIKQLAEEKRFATPEEQSILVKYTGWGGLSYVFKKGKTGSGHSNLLIMRKIRKKTSLLAQKINELRTTLLCCSFRAQEKKNNLKIDTFSSGFQH